MTSAENREATRETETNAGHTKQHHIESLLRDRQNSKLPISVYRNSEKPTKFMFGFVVSFSDDFLVMAHISPYGLYDGYVTIEREDIFRVDIDGRYEAALRDLYVHQGQSHKAVPCNSGDPIYDLLVFAHTNKLVAAIELFGSGVFDTQGFVEKVDGETVWVSRLTDLGECDGTSVINLKDITDLSVDSDDEMKIRILHTLKTS